MKRIIAILLCAVMLSGCGSQSQPETSSAASKESNLSETPVSSTVIPEVNDYSERTYKVKDIPDYLLESYRCVYYDGGLTLDQAGSSVTFIADCEGDVTVNINASCFSEATSHRYYTVCVDGEVTYRVTATVDRSTSNSLIAVKVAEGLERGEHQISLYRATPAEYSKETIRSITINGVPKPKPERKDMLIEFVGDSITAGLDTFENAGDKWDTPEFSDSTQTYAFFTAQMLDAEYASVCCGGLPFIAPLGGMTIKERYLKIGPSRPDRFEFDRSADIVVVNLGTNDFGGTKMKDNNLTDEDAIELAKSFIAFLKLKNPNAKIVWAYGMLGQMGESIIKSAIEQSGGQEQGVYYCPLPRNLEGDTGHPNVASHKNAAGVLTEFIKQNVL